MTLIHLKVKVNIKIDRKRGISVILILFHFDLIVPFKIENLLGIDLDPDPLLDPGHEDRPGDAPRLVVQLAQVQVSLVLLKQQLGPCVGGPGV